MHTPAPAVGVIGSGRVGAVLAARLHAAGYPVVAHARSEASRLRLRALLPQVDVVDPAEVAQRAEILVLAVPDDVLAEVVDMVGPDVVPGTLVLHTSGRHGRAVLAPLAAAGARTVAFHPAMTFTGTEVDLQRSCMFGVTSEADDRAAVLDLAAALGGTVTWIAEADRVAYHAALAHGANHLVTVVNQALDLLRSIGAADPAAILEPLLGAALANTLAYGDAALTGPVVRGDLDTVRAHRDALSGDVDVAATYAALASATAGRAEHDGRLSAATADRVRDLFDPAVVGTPDRDGAA